MASERLANRWMIAVAAVVMQICLGAAYGWSVFVKPLQAAHHWTLTQVSLNFTIAIAVLGVGTIIGGLWQDRVGPRRVATVGRHYLRNRLPTGRVRFSGGITGWDVSFLWSAQRAGNGDGVHHSRSHISEVVPGSARIDDWSCGCRIRSGRLDLQPHRRTVDQTVGVPATFWIFGAVYLVLVVAAAQFYENPPQGWRPAGWVPTGTVEKAASTVDFTVSEAMRTWQFWLLWAMLFLNVSAGIMIISQASPLAQQLANISPLQAAGMVGLISIFNGAGRVFWAWVSDHIGRAQVFFLL